MKQKYAILVIVFACILLSGCIEEFNIDKVIEAQKNVRQYTFESEIIYGAAGTTFNVSMNGKVDIENNKMYVNITMMEEGVEMYLIGDEIYMMQAGQWVKVPRSNLPWTSGGAYFEGIADHNKTAEILKSPKTKIKVVGEEIVDRVACYKVDIVPDPEKLKDQVGKGLGMPQDLAMNYTINYTINVSSYIIYVDKTTNFIKREDINSTIEIFMQGMKIMEMSAQRKFVRKDINKEIDIQLPEEAKSAKQHEMI